MSAPNSLKVIWPCKVNGMLRVLSQEESGFHQLCTLFIPLQWGDEIRLSLLEGDTVLLKQTEQGVEDTLPMESNLAYLAARALQEHAPSPKGALIELYKRVPKGAGLGGGSSNAAAVLRLLNHLWELDLPLEELKRIGLSLGSDVPALIDPVPAIGLSRGEFLEPIGLPALDVLLVLPRVHSSTQQAFSALDSSTFPGQEEGAFLSSALQADPWLVLKEQGNDFEPWAVQVFPLVASVLEKFKALAPKAVISPRLSGSGSALFAAFDDKAKALDVKALLEESLKQELVDKQVEIIQTQSLSPQGGG